MSSTRADSTSNSQSVFSEKVPVDTFLTWHSADGAYQMRWNGGQTIEVDSGQGFRWERPSCEWSLDDLIGVYDYAKGEITIKTFAEFAEVCEQYVQEREAMFEDGEGDE